ncbi:unnamed protein product [Phytophthora fragariaefolia]|uniref:Unnamed protein product n=1 Tax=Phytophthora fragariaefolia TaxID=1490495 RepID=A0A9W6XDN9_9STRA|nr:unnamed protein product [Phytophthora fragariaefolia]
MLLRSTSAFRELFTCQRPELSCRGGRAVKQLAFKLLISYLEMGTSVSASVLTGPALSVSTVQDWYCPLNVDATRSAQSHLSSWRACSSAVSRRSRVQPPPKPLVDTDRAQLVEVVAPLDSLTVWRRVSSKMRHQFRGHEIPTATPAKDAATGLQLVHKPVRATRPLPTA